MTDMPKIGGLFKGDGESWKAYAHRLEHRIKEQRDALDSLQKVHAACPNRSERKRITQLELALGRATLRADRHKQSVKALVERAS